MLTVGLLVTLTAKAGREGDLTDLLRQAQALAEQEEQTVVWFAVRLDEQRFAIFDAFEADAGRDAHLAGAVAEALVANAEELLTEPPVIERVEMLAHTGV